MKSTLPGLICALVFIPFLGCDSNGPPLGEDSFVDTLAVGEFELLAFPSADIRRLELDGDSLYVAAGVHGLFRKQLYTDEGEWEYLGFADTSSSQLSYVTDIDASGDDLLLSRRAPIPDATLWHSQDGGTTWSRADEGVFDSTCGDPNQVVFAIERSPHEEDVVLASKLFIYRSVERGNSWMQTNFGFPSGLCGFGNHANLYWNPGRSGEVWHDLIGDIGFNSVWLSRDYGLTWEYTGLESFGVSGIAFDALDPEVVFLGAGDGLRRSRDGGATWAFLITDERIRAVVTHPLEANVLYAATTQELLESLDGGESFRTIPLPIALDLSRTPMVYDPTTESLFLATQEEVLRYKAHNN